MTSKPERREFWLDLATSYGDPCDFISEGVPHIGPSATNIHVIEKLPGDVVISREEFRAAWKKMDLDYDGPYMQDVEREIFGEESK